MKFPLITNYNANEHTEIQVRLIKITYPFRSARKLGK